MGVGYEQRNGGCVGLQIVLFTAGAAAAGLSGTYEWFLGCIECCNFI